MAKFEGRVHALSPWGAAEISFWTNPEWDAHSPRFRFNGIRKRAAMHSYLRWAEATPLPNMEKTQRRLRLGPGNAEGMIHPWCMFFNCSYEDCVGMH